jgi:hypothetical protein
MGPSIWSRNACSFPSKYETTFHTHKNESVIFYILIITVFESRWDHSSFRNEYDKNTSEFILLYEFYLHPTFAFLNIISRYLNSEQFSRDNVSISMSKRYENTARWIMVNNEQLRN